MKYNRIMPGSKSIHLEECLKDEFIGVDFGINEDLSSYLSDDIATFKNNMDGMMKGLRSTKPMPGHDRVVYPGLPEHEVRIERNKNGIPLHPEVIEWFKAICSELEIQENL